MLTHTWLGRIFRVLPQVRTVLLTGCLYAFVLELLKLAPPYFMKLIVDMLVAPQPEIGMLAILCGMVLFVSLFVTAIEDRYTLSTGVCMFSLETAILRRAHAKLLSLDLRYHEAHPSGEAVQLLSKGASRLAEFVWYARDQFLGALFQIILTSLLLIVVHPWCGLVFVAFMPVVLVLVYRSAKRVQPYRHRYHEMGRRAAWEMNQSLINIRTVKDFGQEARERQKAGDLWDEYRKLAEVRIRTETTDTRNRDIVLGIARFAVLFYAVYLVYTGHMTAGTLLLFATLSEKVISSLFRLGRLYSFLGDSMESIDQLSALFEESPSVVDPPKPLDCRSLNGNVHYRGVAFEYTAGIPVLKDVDLYIPARTTIALVGRSGSGKTTMIKLLCRHYDVTAGEIAIDGSDIRSFRVSEYRKQIAVVSQDIEVFDTTVKENISYGLSVADEQIERAARAAHAHEFITKLPHGYDTRIGERGVRLSGGQRQRLGIARALAMRPAILVFDEATSSLDTESEREIQHALSAIAKEHTTIIIAHRLSTIEAADLAVVFEDGRIVEVGSPRELIARAGVFAYMRQLQILGELRE